jgi:hypothetical protein
MSQEKSEAQLAYEEKYETRPGRYVCKIDSVEVSEVNPWGYSHFMVNMTSENGKSIRAKLERTREKDHEKSKEIKLKIIDEFLSNSGIDTKLKKGREAIDDLVGRSIKCKFRTVKYVGKMKDGKPIERDYLGLYYTSGVDDEMTPLDEVKAVLELNRYDKDKLAERLAEWNMQNSGGGQRQSSPITPRQEEEEDDLPF